MLRCCAAACGACRPAFKIARASTAIALASASCRPAAARPTEQPFWAGSTGTAASRPALAERPAAIPPGPTGAACRWCPLSIVRRTDSAAARAATTPRLRGRSTFCFLPTLNRDFFGPMRGGCQATASAREAPGVGQDHPSPPCAQTARLGSLDGRGPGRCVLPHAAVRRLAFLRRVSSAGYWHGYYT